MDRQAEALEQRLDEVRSSDDTVRSQAASDLAGVLEKYVGPVPGMPPDYEGWIPDELRLRRPTKKEIARIVRVLHETILRLPPSGPEMFLLGPRDPNSKGALFFALSKGPSDLVGPVILDVVVRRGVKLSEAETYQAMLALSDCVWTRPKAAAVWPSMGPDLRELDPRPWLGRAVESPWSDENVREAAEHGLDEIQRAFRASRPSRLARWRPTSARTDD